MLTIIYLEVIMFLRKTTQLVFLSLLISSIPMPIKAWSFTDYLWDSMKTFKNTIEDNPWQSIISSSLISMAALIYLYRIKSQPTVVAPIIDQAKVDSERLK